VPVFYVATGLTLDVRGLFADDEALLQVPVFLLALLLVRGVPALLYLSAAGPRTTAAAALLQATSLPFIVTATQVGLATGAISEVSAAALSPQASCRCPVPHCGVRAAPPDPRRQHTVPHPPQPNRTHHRDPPADSGTSTPVLEPAAAAFAAATSAPPFLYELPPSEGRLAVDQAQSPRSRSRARPSRPSRSART
jgi:Kef-type K+ transport system membrane component KefB